MVDELVGAVCCRVQISQVADILDATDVAEISTLPGLLGLPSIYKAGGATESQLSAKKTALSVAMTLLRHMTAEQAVTMADMLIPGGARLLLCKSVGLSTGAFSTSMCW